MYGMNFIPTNMLKRSFKIEILYNYINRRTAGHSKWANIKHTKQSKDMERMKLFTKLSQQIKVAINEGGSINPKSNVKLEQMIAQARRWNMPVATIESVIKSTQKDKSQVKSYTFEIRGPSHCMILVEVCSPNIIKTKNSISSLMKKHSCKYSEGGGRHLFHYKGLIETEIPTAISSKTKEEILEIATTHAIECEAEDVALSESNSLEFSCDQHNFMKVQKNLEQLQYQIVSASLDFIPIMQVSLSDNDIDVCSKFFDKLSSMDDVVGIYNNIA